jgi:hypothetical protein
VLYRRFVDILAIVGVLSLSLLLAFAAASAGLRAAFYLIERVPLAVHNPAENPDSTDPRT